MTLRRRTVRALAAVFAALVVVSVGAGVAQAAPAGFPNLGDAAKFTVFALNGSGSGQKVNFSLVTVNGNVGVASGSSVTNQAPSKVNGDVFVDSGGSFTGPGTVTGTVHTGQSLAPDRTTVINASNEAAALTPTVTRGSVTSSTTITGFSGLNVIQINGSINLNNGSLTLTGPSDAYFVVNLTGSITLVGSGGIHVGGSVPRSQLVVNMTGNGTSINTHVGNDIQGTTIGVHTGGNLDGTFGSLFLGNDFTLLSGAVVNNTTPPTPPNVYLGYADSYPPRITSPDFPNPWKGGNSVINPLLPVVFVGCGYQQADTCPTIPGTTTDWYDDGAIRLDNPTTGTTLNFTGTGSKVTIGYCVYTPWNGLTATVQPGQTLILSQTGGTEPCGPQVFAHTGINVVPINFPPNENLDTTESYAQSANYLNFVQGGPPVCSNDGLTPVVSLQINGQTTTITDNGQILNHGGVDIGGPICGVSFTASTTNGSTVLTHVQTSLGGTSGLVVGTNITGAGFPNGFTLGESITAVNAAADTITVSDAANVTANGLIEEELFSEGHAWSTSGVSVSAATHIRHATVRNRHRTHAGRRSHARRHVRRSLWRRAGRG